MQQFCRSSILSTIGNTPIIRLNNVANSVSADIYAKLEYFNPGGSIKDRAGVYMCQSAVERGELTPGMCIVEGTSGNTGVGVCLFANTYKHPCVFVMADKQSPEKINNLKAYGAKVVICPTDVAPDDPRSYYSVADKLAKILGAYHLNQYDNPDNIECHYTQTGPEIWRQTGGEFDVLVAGVGTGGTISGIGRYIKQQNPDVKIIGVDCEGSVFARYYHYKDTQGAAGYLLEGLGGSWIPANIDFSVIDGFEVVGDSESFRMSRALLAQEGIFAGGSSGAAVAAAINYSYKQSRPQRILVILPDSGNRYGSKIYNDNWMATQGFEPFIGAGELENQISSILNEECYLA